VLLALAFTLSSSACHMECHGSAGGVGVWASRAEVEKGLRQVLSDQTGLAPEKIVCPGSGEKIETLDGHFACTVTVAGTDVVFEVAVDLDHQRLNFQAEKVFAGTRKIEEIIATMSRNELGRPVTVSCPGPELRFSDPTPAGEFDCEATYVGTVDADAGPPRPVGSHDTVHVHWADTEGNVRFEYVDPPKP